MRVDLPPPQRGGVGRGLGEVARPERADDAQLLVVPVEDRTPVVWSLGCGVWSLGFGFGVWGVGG